jgi:hypothetical protein
MLYAGILAEDREILNRHVKEEIQSGRPGGTYV